MSLRQTSGTLSNPTRFFVLVSVSDGVTRLWCRSNYGTVTRGLRWESTGTWWAISSVMRSRIVQPVSLNTRPKLVQLLLSLFCC